MAVYNYASGEINIKIVYYGPGLSGKTTNLEHIYSKLPRDFKGKMVSMKTRADRTLFFDFLPIQVGEINNMRIRFLLYTVPGQVYYNATRKLVLKGVDAVVFVADSAPEKSSENKESLSNLEENLNDLGMTLKQMPWVAQLNKRDLPNRVEAAVMIKELGIAGVPVFESTATTGEGVYETFQAVSRIVFTRIQSEIQDNKIRPGLEKRGEESVSAEVVAKGASGRTDSETDEGESLVSAEENEEEHESVSEFVESMLHEKAGEEESIDLGASRDGYEEYGHLVELGDEADEPEPVDTEAGEPASGESLEIISDPLEKFSGGQAVATKPEKAPATEREPARPERTVHVPVVIPKEEIGGDVRVHVILEVRAE